MLIKEYRIPLPLTVEEYRIAQLYMIQKKSREESEGEGSAVEILENRPYTDGPNGSGQYTYKVYHIGRHLPGWCRNIVPKSALEVHEESWNAYPYTKTKFGVPFIDKFSIEVETYFEADNGSQENMFRLNRSELRQRELDVIDIVNDQLSGSDYVVEEDPCIYTSKKNERGPLNSDWITNPPDDIIMCAYKMIKVEFRYWGLQSKIERFIHDYGMRRVMLRAHRQAWAWQDEWVGLTIDDIRRLERETQLILQLKLGRTPLDVADIGEEKEEEESAVSDEMQGNCIDITSLTNNTDAGSTSVSIANPATPKMSTTLSSLPHSSSRQDLMTNRVYNTYSLQGKSARDGRNVWERKCSNWKRRQGSLQGAIPRKFSSTSVKNMESYCMSHDINLSRDAARRVIRSYSGPVADWEPEMVRPECALNQIELSDSDSDLEFFDARDTIDSDEDSQAEEEVEEEENGEICSQQHITTLEEALKPRHRAEWSSCITNSIDISGDDMEMDTKASSTDILFLVLHGGTIYNSISDHKDVSNELDFSTFSKNVDTITKLHFSSAIGRIAMRMVACRDVCKDTLRMLSEVSPFPVNCSEDMKRTIAQEPLNRQEDNNGLHIFPVGVIPLMATQAHAYKEFLKQAVADANTVYKEFLLSEEGQNFRGQVCLIGDCMGSVIGYDILSTLTPSPGCSPSPSPRPLSPMPQSSPQLILSPMPPLSPKRSSPQSLSLSSTYSHSTFQSNMRLSRQRKTSAGSLSSKNGGFFSQKLRKSACRTSDQACSPTSPYLQAVHDQKFLCQLDSLSPTKDYYTSNTSINIISEDMNEDDSVLCFDVSHFFAFGSPLGMILANRRARKRDTVSTPPAPPTCRTFYNLFYGMDQIASRLEPLLDQRFAMLSAMSIPNYKAFPTGSNESYTLKDTVMKHPYLLGSQCLGGQSLTVPMEGAEGRKAISNECLFSMSDSSPGSTEPTSMADTYIKPISVWWSDLRLDYMLETPCKDGFEMLPDAAMVRIFHSRYWEAKELVSFILRQVLQQEVVCVTDRGDRQATMLLPFMPQESVVKWNKRTTSMRIHRLKSTHRASDLLLLDGVTSLSIMARFQYGPLAITSLCKEEVEVYVFHQRPKPGWEFIGSDLTDKHGRIMFNISEKKSFSPGLYPVRFLVKGDHTTASCNLFVVPPHVEAVVFSVDGALASNFSISAKDIKLKSGAVEVARSWQELGYLIIYISGRPDLQKDYILNFLGSHDFPLGLVACAESFSTDSQSVKTAYLARLIKQAKVIIHAGYGSSRHLSVYKELGLQSNQIYIHHGRKSKARRLSVECQYLCDGFSSHQNSLLSDPPRKAMQDAREWFGDACFTLPGSKLPGRRTPVKKSWNVNKRSAVYWSQTSTTSIESQSRH